MIESGKKKVVAVAFDWPGWERSGASEAEALEVLEGYRPRFAKVAELAGLGAAFAAAGRLEVVDRIEGSGTTDFYGISAKSATAEHEPLSEAEADRKIALLQAAWAYFDSVPPRVSAELRKGPRGGGRSRDQIVRHTLGSEREHVKKVGVTLPPELMYDLEALRASRVPYVAGLRDLARRGETMARSWTLQFLIRRSAYHSLDHAWEMEDKDPGPS
jgi:hypothetical protein